MTWAITGGALILAAGALGLGLLSLGRLRKLSSDARAAELRPVLEEAHTAMQSGQWEQAVQAVDRALGLMGQARPASRLESWADRRMGLRPADPAVETQLRLDKASALESLRRPQQALAEYEACWAAVDLRARHAHGPQLALRHGVLLIALNRVQDAERLLRQCLALTERGEAPQLRLNALRALAGVLQSTRRSDEAIDSAQSGLGLARTLGDEFAVVVFLDVLGDLNLAAGRRQDALRCYELSLDGFRAQGYRRAQVIAQRDIALLHQAGGDWAKALAWLQVCLEEHERADDLAGQAVISYELACLLINSGRLPDAAGLLVQSMGLFRRAQDRAGIDRVGRTLMGLGITLQRHAAAGRMTFRDIERGSVKLKKEEEES